MQEQREMEKLALLPAAENCAFLPLASYTFTPFLAPQCLCTLELSSEEDLSLPCNSWLKTEVPRPSHLTAVGLSDTYYAPRS